MTSIDDFDLPFDFFVKDSIADVLECDSFFDTNLFVQEERTVVPLENPVDSVSRPEAEFTSTSDSISVSEHSLSGNDEESVRSCSKSPVSTPKRELENDSVCSTSSDSDETEQSTKSSQSSKNSKKRKRNQSQTGSDKAKKRREANRISAAASRERKKMYMKELEARVKEMETEKASLIQNMTITQMENRRLRTLMEQLTRSGFASSTSALSNSSASLKETEISTVPEITSLESVESLDSLEPPLKRSRAEDELSISPMVTSFDEPNKSELEDNPFAVSFWDRIPGKAVMFAMIFCIAMFVGFSGQKSDLFYGGKASKQSSPVRVGRRILTSRMDTSPKAFLRSPAFVEKAQSYIENLLAKRDDVHQYNPSNDQVVAHSEF